MLSLKTVVRVDGLAAGDVYDFMTEPSDRAYQQWWPGTHLEFHRLRSHPDHVGDVLYVDEYVGKRRLRFHGIVTEAVPDKRLVWQFTGPPRLPLKLPAWLSMDFADDEGGVTITHIVEIGYDGIGSILDPLLRLYVTSAFAEALDEHAKTEFPMFRDRLDEIRAEPIDRQMANSDPADGE